MWLRRSNLLLAALLALNITTQRTVSAEGEPCYKAANNSPGTCISMRSCTPYVNLLKEHGTKVGPFLRSTVCYFDGNNPVVCCPPFNGPSNPPTIATDPPYQTEPTTQSYGGGFDFQTCGISKAQHNRVVGGVPSALGAWPWITALGYRNKKDPRKPKWNCGGSLVSSQHVLTAAHCVFNRTDLYLARLGEHDIKRDNDGANPIDVYIILGVIHPGYSAVNYVNDIAMLKLAKPVTFTAAIHPICLPNLQTKSKENPGTTPFLAGWGAVEFHGPSADVLQEVQLPIVSLEKCNKAYAPFKTQVIDERVVCAGWTNGGRDACQGDSGGPLMAPINSERFAIIGVVSYGYKCAEPNIPGVYTRVSYFLDFINDVMQK